jgi:hypothetical protein
MAPDSNSRIAPQLEAQGIGARIVWLVELDQASLGRPMPGRIRAFVRDGLIVTLAHVFARKDADAIKPIWLSDAYARTAADEPAPPPGLAVCTALGGLVVVAGGIGHRARRRPAAAAVHRINVIAGLRRAYHLD